MTLIPFQPSSTSSPPFQVIVTLDGASYSLATTWNLYGQRWYFTLTDLSGNLIWSGALVGSPIGSDIELAPGIFTASTLVFRDDTNNFEIAP